MKQKPKAVKQKPRTKPADVSMALWEGWGCQRCAQAADSQHGSSLMCSLLSRPSRHRQQRSPGVMEQRPPGPLPKGGQRPAQLWLPRTREGTMVTALRVLGQRGPGRPQWARLRGRCLGRLGKLSRRRRGLKARQGNPRQPEVLATGRLHRRRHPLPWWARRCTRGPRSLAVQHCAQLSPDPWGLNWF